MKRRDLLASLQATAKKNGLTYREEEGGNHTKVWFGNRQTVVARHREITRSPPRAF